MALAPACVPRYAKVDSACGCTLTALKIKGLTPAEIENLQTKEIDLARVILQGPEAKALGVQERGIGMLLRSSVKNIKDQLSTQKIGRQSIVLPYVMRPQPAWINANYFTIQGGAATPGAGANGIPASAWNLTLFLSDSWLKSDLENIERYFLPGNTLIVHTWDNVNSKNAKTHVFTIVKAVNADTDIRKAVVTVYPNISAGDWALMNGPAKAAFQPTFGVAQTGVNSVTNREAWCSEQPANISKKLLVNWLQTSRTSRCVDDEYMRILDAIMKGKVNEYQKGMVWQDLSEQNKQKTMLEEEAFYRTIFYGQAIDRNNQKPETYDKLPTVADPMDPTCPLEYKSSALGFFTLLSDCNRVVDLNGGALDLDFIFDQLYFIMQHRMASGDNITVIDSMTDRWTADNIFNAMTKFYKAKYGWDTTRFAKIGEQITHDNVVLFNYDIYDVKPVGVKWAVFHDAFFDHMLAAFPDDVGGQAVNFKDRARQLWFLDWSDISVGMAGTMAVTRSNPDPTTSDLYKCVMVANVKKFNLRSQTFTPMLDRPHRHLIIYNFSDACPHVGVKYCPVPNS